MTTEILPLMGLLAVFVAGIFAVYFSLVFIAGIIHFFTKGIGERRKRREQRLLKKKEAAQAKIKDAELQKNQSLETELENLRKQLSLLKASEEKARKELKEKDEACLLSGAREAELNQKFASLNRRAVELERIQHEHELLNRQFFDLKSVEQSTQLQCRSLTQQLEKTAQLLRKQEEAHLLSEAEQKKLTEELASLKLRNEILNKQTAQLKDKYDKNLFCAEELKVQLAGTQYTMENNEKAALEARREEQGLRQQVASLRKSEDELKKAKSENESLADAMGQLRIKYQVASATMESLSKELEEARQVEHRESGARSGMIQEKQEVLKKLQEEHSSLKRAYEEAREEVKKIKPLFQEEKNHSLRLKGENKDINSELEQVRSALKKKEEALMAAETRQKELSGELASYQALKKAYEKQKQDLEKTEEAKKRLELLKQENAAKQDELEKELGRSVTTEFELKSELKESEEAHKALERRIEEVTFLKDKVENEAQVIQALLKGEQSKLEDMENEKEALSKEVSQLRQELESARKQAIAAAGNDSKQALKTTSSSVGNAYDLKNDSWQAWLRRFTFNYVGERIWITKGEFDEVEEEIKKKDAIIEKYSRNVQDNTNEAA